MARTGQSPQVYIENPPFVQNEEARVLLRWAVDQFERLAHFHNQLAKGHVEVLHVEPDNPRNGEIRFADGTDWDPGSGEGYYGYKEGTGWVLLG